MKVIVDGIIYQFQLRGGISRLFSEILPRMCDMDESLRITLLTDGTPRQQLPRHSHIVRRVIPSVVRYLRPGRVWKPIIPSARRLVCRLWIGRGEGQIWHSTYYTLPGPWKGLQVVTVADMIHEWFAHQFNSSTYDRFRERKRHCVRRADAVICISETTRQDLHHFYGLDPDSIHVVPLACGDVFRRLELRADGVEQPFLLYVGWRSRYKNFDRLVQAYSVWSHRREVALVVVGIPWSSDEEWRLVELRIQDRVHLLTDVDDEELCQLYNRAIAFVHPSLYEGFGIPLLEAMACGCPIVASRIPSTIEVAGDCPIYFDASDTESLTDAMNVALSERGDSTRRAKGFKQAKKYSWDKTARGTLDVYRRLGG